MIQYTQIILPNKFIHFEIFQEIFIINYLSGFQKFPNGCLLDIMLYKRIIRIDEKR